MRNTMRHYLPPILFTATICLSSFLLFQVQPIISKYLLPYFGGTSAVWTTALLFFQLVLLFGYFYAVIIIKIQGPRQILVHLLLTVLIAFLIIILIPIRSVPILPSVHWTANHRSAPITEVLFLLSMGIGLPYFLLSTTSTILQNWFYRSYPKRSPYVFYALSNTGSLLAIVSYPFFIEPILTLNQQGAVWSMGFLIYCLLILFICLIIWLKTNKTRQQKIFLTKKITPTSPPIRNHKRILLWILLCANSTLMLISVSTIIAQEIAPLPFLWLLPMGLYLLSFMLCFSNKKLYKRNLCAYLFLILTPFAFIETQTIIPNILLTLALYSALLFACFMICHGELYVLKPAPEQLELYYLCIAVGGALGGFIAAIIAPLLFKGTLEFSIGMCVSLSIAYGVLIYYKNSSLYRFFAQRFSSQREMYAFFVVAITVLSIFFLIFKARLVDNSIIKTYRNFYGIETIIKRKTTLGTVISVVSGKITHGSQIDTDLLKNEPTTYYSKESGIGYLMLNFPKFLSLNHSLRVGIVGLGAGTLAAYGRKDDLYRFYEINPDMVTIANTHFTYLRDSFARTEIVLGDGRLAIESEPPNHQYDLLVLDAFSGDAIPVHLLTKEAFSIYLNRLNSSSGILAIHITNTYLDLAPVVHTVAEYYQLEESATHTPPNGNQSESSWIILSKNRQLLDALMKNYQYKEKATEKSISLWTDNFSNILQIIK